MAAPALIARNLEVPRSVARWRARATTIAVVGASIGLGFIVTYRGLATWDSQAHLERSQWILHRLHLPSSRTAEGLNPLLKWYGPLWMLVLGLFTEVALRFLRDPLWVEHALTFALFPLGLLALQRLLERAGVKRATAWLAVAMLIGIVRLGGHALLNVNDFPFAMAYLLVTVYLWLALRDTHLRAQAAQAYPRRVLVAVGVLAVVPYLVRTPVLVHLPVLCAFMLVYGRVALPSASWRTRASLVLIPLASAFVFTWLVWPPLQGRGLGRWLELVHSFRGFSSFDLAGRVRAFGIFMPCAHLPAWYPFLWLPVILHPLAFVACLAGWAAYLRPSSLAPHSFVLGRGGARVDVSLRRWLALFTAIAWLGVIAIRPVLYDEERHILFLYPPLVVLAALGLDNLGARVKYALAALIVAASLVSYVGWGRYAYVYKSPLVGDRGAKRFMGDYWGACVPLAIAALPGLVPAGTEVVIPEPLDAARLQDTRLRVGRLSHVEGYGPYRLSAKPSGARYVAIVYNRLGFNDRAIEAAAHGEAELLWRAEMPPGDTACVMVRYGR